MNARLIIGAFLVLGVSSAARAVAQTSDAKTAYDENCRKCHGVRGVPPKTMKEKFPKIVTFDTAFVGAHSVDSIVKVLTKGKNDDMKSFKDRMTPDEMAAVAKYVRQLGAKTGG